MSTPRDGGPALPPSPEPMAAAQRGMSLRDYMAAHAPVTADHALQACGFDTLPLDDLERATLHAVWAMLRYEHADAMLRERERES